MTAAERTQQRVIRDLRARVALLEAENERVKARRQEERRRWRLEKERLQTTIAQQTGKRHKALEQGRYWHGVAVANGVGSGE